MKTKNIFFLVCLALVSITFSGCANEQNSKAVDDVLKSDQEKADSFKREMEKKGMKLD